MAGLYYCGSAGLEVDYESKRVTHPLVRHSARLLGQVAEGLRVLLPDFPGAWLEEKRFGLTIHYRKLDSQLVSSLYRALDRELAQWGDRLHIVTGGKAVEIFPNVGWTKGTAVDFLLDQLGDEPCQVLYAGDEASDAEALWSVSIHRGIAIGVGPSPPTVAQFKLPDPAAVRGLLDHLCHALGTPEHN